MLVSTRLIKWLESWYEWLEKQRKKREKEPEPFSIDVYSVFAEKNKQGKDKVCIVGKQEKKLMFGLKQMLN